MRGLGALFQKKIFIIIIVLSGIFLLLGIISAQFFSLEIGESEGIKHHSLIEILKTNFTVFAILASGVFFFRISTMLSIAINNFVFGFIISHTVSFYSASILIAVFAHGIFEISSFLIASFIGFSNIKNLRKYKKKFIIIGAIGCLLLIFAGLIETYISPQILKEVI